MDVVKKGYAEPRQDFHKIRITLTSTNVKSVESVTTDLLTKAEEKGVESIKGPVRLPTKRLRITTRKSPCGEGTNTWDRWQMRIHKRLIDIEATQTLVKEITKIKIPAGVEVEVAFVNVESSV